MDTIRVSVDGEQVGPTFEGGQDDVHLWVARAFPGKRYTVTTYTDGTLGMVVTYPPGGATAAEEGADDELLDGVRRRIESLEDARIIRALGPNEQAEYDELLRLEEHLLKQGVRAGPSRR